MAFTHKQGSKFDTDYGGSGHEHVILSGKSGDSGMFQQRFRGKILARVLGFLAQIYIDLLQTLHFISTICMMVVTCV